MKSLYSSKGRLLYLNSGFDLELSATCSHHLHGAISQMTQWFIPAGGPGDCVLVDMPPPDEFVEYLRGMGLSPARFTMKECPLALEGEAWGWNGASVKRLIESGAEVNHPPLDAVRNVNSRAFCHKIGLENELGIPGAYMESDPLRLLDSMACPSGPIVCKTMHSNAGRGMQVRRGNLWSEKQIAFIKKIASGGQTVVVEPWLARLGDISTRFDLSVEGEIRNVFHYWTLIGPDGHCAADLLEPDCVCFDPWTTSLDRACQIAASDLFGAGYFGPVGLDHLIFHNGEQLGLAALVDINARHTLGTLALALWNKLQRNNLLLMRLISAKKHRLPAEYADLQKLLGELSWDRNKGEGVILLTALRVESGGTLVQPRRSMFCIQASNRESLKRIYSGLLKRLGQNLDNRLPFEPLLY